MPTINEILKTMDYGPAPESTKETNAWLDQHERRFGLFIDNAWTAPGQTFATSNPADGKEIAQVTQASTDGVNRAVEAARRAQPGWVALGGHGRARILYALARLLQKHSRLFAVLEPALKFSRAEFVPATGMLNSMRKASDVSAWKQFSSMLAPLHFGFYGATWVKWAYFFGGLAPSLLAITGLLIWFRRQRRGSSNGFTANSPQFRAGRVASEPASGQPL